jgi:hypothetical protein
LRSQKCKVELEGPLLGGIGKYFVKDPSHSSVGRKLYIFIFHENKPITRFNKGYNALSLRYLETNSLVVVLNYAPLNEYPCFGVSI